MKNYRTVFVAVVSCSHQGTCGINACLVEGHFICKMKFLVAPANGCAQPEFEMAFQLFLSPPLTGEVRMGGKQGVTGDLCTY